MNSQPALRTGLYNLLTNSAELTALISTRVYYHEALHNATLPYVVFDILNSLEDRDSASKFFPHMCQFTVAGTTLGSVESVMTALTNALDDKESSLTVTGFGIITITKDFQRLPEYIDKVWNQIIQYTITTQK